MAWCGWEEWHPDLNPSGVAGLLCSSRMFKHKGVHMCTGHQVSLGHSSRKGKQCTVNTVYSGDDVLLTSTKDVVERWREYFKDLLNPTDLPSSKEAVPGNPGLKLPRWLKNSSVALGMEEIHPEILKALDVVGLPWLTRLCNVVWTGVIPLNWKTRVVVPLFKKVDRQVHSNYRRITLLSLPGTVYSGALGRRVRRIVEPQIKEEQCDFCPWRGTVD